MRISNTKEKLLDVAQDLIQRRGVNAVSFQNLSDEVGIRKASVHHHFASNSAMVDALLDRYLKQFSQLLQQILQTNVTGRTKLKRYCQLFTETLKSGQQDKVCLCGILMAEVMSLGNQSQHLVRQFLTTNTDAIASILKEGVNDGSLELKSSVNSTASMILATLEGGMLLARCDGGAERLVAMSTQLIRQLTP